MAKLALTVGIFALTLAAHAQVINTYPEYTGNITNGYGGTAQTFAAPTSELLSYQFGIQGAAAGNELTISLYSWLGLAPVGSALYSTTVAWPTSAGDVLISNIDTVLTTGAEYGVIVNFDGFTGQSENYVSKGGSDPNPGGNGYWSLTPSNSADWAGLTTLDTEFKATFSPAPEPFTVVGTAIGCIALLRRRFKTNA